MHVVSMYCPRPEHPYFQDYRPFLRLLRQSCERFGHRHLVLTDDPMEVGDDDAYPVHVPRSLMKATIAAQLAYLSDPAMADQPTLLVGADCVLAKDPEMLAASDADISITVGDFADCRMNTGCCYIPRPARLAGVWAEAMTHVGDDWGTDQTALYLAIRKAAMTGLKVLELPVDPFNLAPTSPSEDCTRGVVVHFRGPRKRWMVDYCHKWFGLGAGISVIALPNLPDTIMREHVLSNVKRSLPEVQRAEAHDGHAVLVGGGPSLASCRDEIAWRASQGQTIFGLNGTTRWLLQHGIAPDHGVILDPREANGQFVVPMDGEWLIASQCHPAVFDMLAGQQVRVWHFASPDNIAALPPGSLTIGGGLTVGLSAMGLAFAMGYRQLHLYGYDSSDAEGAAHAYEQAECDIEQRRLEVWCNGRSFWSGAAMYAQAEAFPRWAVTLIEAGALITVHGEGLLPTLARTMQGATLLEAQTA